MGRGHGRGRGRGRAGGRPHAGARDRDLGPAARLRSPGRRGSGHPPGQALVRHEHGRGVRDPDPQARRDEGGPAQDRAPLSARLHRAQGPLAQAPRACEFPEAAAHPPAPRLPQFPPHRPLLHGAWRRLGDGLPRCAAAGLVGGGDRGGRRPGRRLPAPGHRLPRALRHPQGGARRALRLSQGDDRQRGRRRQHDGGDRDRQRRPRRGHREFRDQRDDLRLRASPGRRPARARSPPFAPRPADGCPSCAR